MAAAVVEQPNSKAPPDPGAGVHLTPSAELFILIITGVYLMSFFIYALY